MEFRIARETQNDDLKNLGRYNPYQGPNQKVCSFDWCVMPMCISLNLSIIFCLNARLLDFVGWIHSIVSTFEDWFVDILLSSSIQLNLDEDGKVKVFHFATIIFDHIWLVRNKIRLGLDMLDWMVFSHQLNRTFHKY